MLSHFKIYAYIFYIILVISFMTVSSLTLNLHKILSWDNIETPWIFLCQRTSNFLEHVSFPSMLISYLPPWNLHVFKISKGLKLQEDICDKANKI